MDLDIGALRSRLESCGQGHVLAFWKDLPAPSREKLARQISEIDLDLFGRLVEQFVSGKDGHDDGADAEIEPAQSVPVPETAEQLAEARAAAAAGEETLAAGKVAVFVVAGGQGSRLGFDGPKGDFEVGPVTDRTLFRIHAEKILAGSRRYGVTIPWFIMTSETNHGDTVEIMRANDYFGLDESNVYCFKQSMVPASDPDGRMYLAAKDRIFTSPNGHGGSLQALYDSGALGEMKKRGIELLSYFQVDNPLVKVLDQIFIGRHVQAGAEMSSKVVAKRSPDEKVGVIARCGGKLGVVEYSDLPKELMHATDDDGVLIFNGGSIAIHLLGVDFVERMNEGGLRIPWHKAQKRVPYIDARGEIIEPEEKNGIKFETFVFDALAYAEAPVTMEVQRSEEFSPVKNAEGDDSPATCRRDMTELYAKWIEAAGGAVERGEDGLSRHAIEISPLYALDAEELAGKLASGFSVGGDLVLK